MGWFAYGMEGFDQERAYAQLEVPKAYCIEAVFAIGQLGDPSGLPRELRTREIPSDRLPLSKLAYQRWFREE